MTMRDSRIQRVVLVGMVCGLLAIGLLPGLVQAAPTDLPPRPTPVPTAEPAPVADGGQIVLRTVFGDDWPSTGIEWQALWTVVQWEDPWGYWHDVKGWQGALDKVYASGDQIKGLKSWWVSESLYGKGSFRWLVYASQDGELLAQSAEFNLPERAGQSVVVDVGLTP